MTTELAGGVDVGSCTTKAVIVNNQRQILGSSVLYSGTDFQAASGEAWNECLRQAGAE